MIKNKYSKQRKIKEIKQKTTKKNKKIKTKKKNKKIKTRKNKKQGKIKINHSKKKGGMSGIILKDGFDDEKAAFNIFFSNSSCTYIRTGAYGLTFMLSINDIDLSPYVSTDIETYGLPVNKLLIKTLSIKPEGYEGDGETEFDTKSVSELSFNEENKTQKCIYNKTKEYLEPICPAIVYDEIIRDSSNKQQFLDELKLRLTSDNSFDIYRAIFDTWDLGIIAMEFADGYRTFHDVMRPTNNQFYKEMIMFLILEMAIKTGYAHLDNHTRNVMIKPNDTNYFKKTKPTDIEIIGKPLLIDFGMSVKIKKPILDLVNTLYDTEQYTKALHMLCHVPRSYSVDPSESALFNSNYDQYGWICGFNKDTKIIYDKIFKEAEELSEMPSLNESLTQLYKTQSKNPNFKQEKNTIIEMIRNIQTQISKETTEKIKDIKYMNFPPDTNTNIHRLIEQRRHAESLIVTEFNSSHPSGPVLPLPEKDCE